MDDTQASLKAAESAAATRKRRSSILKSQRPPRTPFSELEFNVATPTDTSKSRRVSFSRRTGVAEFVTNEATTTWKNFYEEHNKSLETSGNEPGANAGRQVIGHIGKRIFDQQFEEVEVVDIGGTLQTNTVFQEFQTSLNNVNLTEQLASLECSADDRKLKAPMHNYDLNSITDNNSKIFGDDLSIPVMNELSNPININFSNIQPLGNSKCDDLEEIQRDLERSNPSNFVCQGPFSGRTDLSEYIEIDLNNMTHVGVRIDDCDMSITDTIQSPKVQEVLKTNTSSHQDKSNSNDDWVVDKENIAMNPYKAPKETLNFAINKVSDEILVFDGKKLTVQSEQKVTLNVNDQNNEIQNKIEINNVTPKRKTIVLNMNDDLPNFAQDSSHVSQSNNDPKDIAKERKSVIYNDCDLSITQSVDNKIEVPKRKTIVFEDDMGNISITQAVPAKVIIHKEEKRKTILYENDLTNLSITQAVPTNIISGNKSITDKRKTIVYEDGDISFTRALPSNLILNDNAKPCQNKTVYFQDDVDMSVTQAIPLNIISTKLDNLERTKNDLTNLSITQAIPCNIIISETKKHDLGKNNDNDANLEAVNIKKAVTDNTSRRKTIIYDQEAGNVSITQAIPSNIIFNNQHNIPDANMSDINKTNENVKNEPVVRTTEEQNDEKMPRKSNVTVYGDQVDVSFTRAIPTNILQSNDYDMEMTSSDNDISITRALPTNILLPEEHIQNEAIEAKEENVTIKDSNKTEAKDISMNAMDNISRLLQDSKLYRNDLSNLSPTKPIPDEIVNIQNDIPRKSHIDGNKSIYNDDNATVNQDILIYQATEQNATVLNDTNRSNFIVEDIKQILNNSRDENNESKRNVTINESAIKIPVNDESNNVSIKHKNVVIERDSLKEIEMVPVSTHESEVIPVDEKFIPKKSILTELLDMSCASLNEVNESVTKGDIDNVRTSVDKKSSESMFLITKDDESGDNVGNVSCIEDVMCKTSKESFQQEELDDKDSEQGYLKQKVDELKIINDVNTKSPNRHYEKVVSSDLQRSIESVDKSTIKHDLSKGKKSIKNIDDTAELLEMLSDFTDGQSDQEENKTIEIAHVKSSENLLNKSKLPRLSFVPKRQSIAFSRENLLSNISMAQAALQQSRFEMDDSESLEDTHTTPEDDEFQKRESPRKSVRMSTEVVKTLQFEEDDSVNENDDNDNTDVEMTPLKKTAFGETTYMKEDKARVIPTYLKDVSDDIKELMNDLVKPMADVLPFETAELNRTKKTPSTCSTQIQASLITSSQIDIDVELRSTNDSIDYIKSNQSIVTEIPAYGNKSHTLKQAFDLSPNKKSLKTDKVPKLETNMNSVIVRQSNSPSLGPVIQFDRHNPLNNILLTQTECLKVHKYNPISSNGESMEDEFVADDGHKSKKSEIGNISLHYNVESQSSCNQSALQSGDARDEKTIELFSIKSNVSKPQSVNCSTEGQSLEFKHTEVNTVIAMKANQELLQASSSLTLVDDALTQSVFDVDIDVPSDDDKKCQVELIYDKDVNDAQLENVNKTNTRKRSYSPTKQDKHRPSRPNVEVTPKPISKMQKISNSPKSKDREQSKIASNNDKSPIQSNLSPERKKSPKKRSSQQDEGITVQQLISECYRIAKMDQDKDHIYESPSATLDTETISPTTESVKSTDTLYLCGNEMQDTNSVDTQAVCEGSEASRVNWQPEVVDVLSSKNLLTECSSSANVVDKINTLPFMGSRECEWESSGGDVWMFRFLRSRVRLTVRLAHSHHNASRSRVRADTQLIALVVEPAKDESDPLAALCVRLAAEAMRYECARAGRAADVPALLRRCAALARVALRWARAMRDARARLAYSVTPDGELTLKVANVPLRAVWEVRLAVELVAEQRGAAWPRAGRVRAAAVLAGARAPSPPRLALLADTLPRDWGHAPAALWKVFKYLKNKTREDDLLGLL